jgi:hypothetical protein
MKLDVVNNEDGPLARSTFTSINHSRNDANKKSLAELPIGVEERLQNIEKHLKAETGDHLFKRVIFHDVYISRGNLILISCND